MTENSPQDPTDPTTPAVPPSGNRWEPSEPQQAATPEPAPLVTTEAAAPLRSPVSRARAGVAGLAAAGLLVAGVGGFALGQVGAGHDEPGTQQVGFQPSDDDGPGERDGDFPGDDDGGRPPAPAPGGDLPGDDGPDGSQT